MGSDSQELQPVDHRHPDNIRRRLERMEHLLEDMVRIPGTNQRLGLDVILDLVPVGGSVVAAAMGTWLAWEARNLGVSKWTLAKMGGNIGFDMLLGAVPVVGWVGDYFFRSNTRNMRLLKRHLDRHHPQQGPQPSAEQGLQQGGGLQP